MTTDCPPREAALELIEPYAAATGVQVVGLGTATPLELGRRLQARVTIQGALDPDLLRTGGSGMAARVDELLEAWSGGPYIFNLGHGVHPDTPIEHITAAVGQVTAWRNP